MSFALKDKPSESCGGTIERVKIATKSIQDSFFPKQLTLLSSILLLGIQCKQRQRIFLEQSSELNYM